MPRNFVARVLFPILFMASVSTLPLSAGAAQKPGKREAVEGSWPDTKAGALARRWVEAFAAGEDAMRAVLTKHMAAESLAERSVEERIDTYRTFRKRFNVLKFSHVVRSRPHELEVMLAASDGSRHKFVFTIENKPPYRLLSVLLHDLHAHPHS